MEIIRDDLNCSAVRIGARDVGRLVTAAEAALDAGLVRPLTGGRMGTSFPDMHWEPKEAIRSVAAYYESAGSLPTGNRPNPPGAAAVTLLPDSSVGATS